MTAMHRWNSDARPAFLHRFTGGTCHATSARHRSWRTADDRWRLSLRPAQRHSGHGSVGRRAAPDGQLGRRQREMAAPDRARPLGMEPRRRLGFGLANTSHIYFAPSYCARRSVVRERVKTKSTFRDHAIRVAFPWRLSVLSSHATEEFACERRITKPRVRRAM